MKVWFTKSDEEPNKARNHPGSTFLYHYQEYVQQAKDPYGYTSLWNIIGVNMPGRKAR
ncbi:hypothetical protein [Gillisia sp. Hel_I_86]|uniref:hypothetical protein n=1 Tax=Gillisia sp. Hel_I_86 TaxID=1249981 RepID=UPI001649715B|nr:hypothetical protein [Gillisia sp. Hel_I_86]